MLRIDKESVVAPGWPAATILHNCFCKLLTPLHVCMLADYVCTTAAAGRHFREVCASCPSDSGIVVNFCDHDLCIRACSTRICRLLRHRKQKRERRRRQPLALHNVRQPEIQTKTSVEENCAAQAVPPAGCSQLSSQPPATAAHCDLKEADAVHLERCISSTHTASESERHILVQ